MALEAVVGNGADLLQNVKRERLDEIGVVAAEAGGGPEMIGG